MSWRDRPYAGGDDGSMGPVRIVWPRPSTVVLGLLVGTVAAYFVDLIWQNRDSRFWHETFGLSWTGLFAGRFWQPLTYMFVHYDQWHLLSNMLILYFFGIEIERILGGRRFLAFYAVCGLAGGLAYLVLSAISPSYRPVVVVGASGGCFGLIMAAMIFFPHMRIIFFFVPMTVRVFGLIMLAFHFIPLLGPGGRGNLGGEVCHMAGAATGLGLIVLWGMLPGVRIGFGVSLRGRLQKGAWERRMRREAEEQAAVDRILAKVSEAGIQSLSRSERKLLEAATRRQQERDRHLDRVSKL